MLDPGLGRVNSRRGDLRDKSTDGVVGSQAPGVRRYHRE
jgi:hypothetical protein